MFRYAVVASRPRPGLLRVFGLTFGITAGVGATIGGGILRTPGPVLGHAPMGGLALLLWGMAGLHALLAANIMAELMSSIPKSGGVFNIAGRAFGAYGAVLVGWTDWLSTVAGIAALAINAGEFLAVLRPDLQPHIPAIGVAAVLLFFGLNWIGVRTGAWTQIASSLAKLALMAGLIGVLFCTRPAALAAPPALPASGISLLGTILAYQLIIGTYAGWPAPAYFAEEDKNPGRNIPIALFAGLIAVTLVYVLMNAALLHVLPIAVLQHLDLPAAVAAKGRLGGWAVEAVSVVAAVAVLDCLNANLMTGTRTLHGMARDGFLPAGFAAVNRGGTPVAGLAVSAALAVALTLTGRFELIFLATGALTVAVSALVDLAYFQLRRTEPDLVRPFRAFGHPWLPLIALLLDAAVTALFLATDLRSAAFMIGGVVLCIPLAALARRRAAAQVQS